MLFFPREFYLFGRITINLIFLHLEKTQMSHSTSIEFKGSYLHVTVTGENTCEDLEGYFKEVYNACQEHNCFNILIEENLSGPSIGTTNTFKVIDRNKSLLMDMAHRMAYVDLNPEHDLRNNQFAETVAMNRGIYVKLFSNVTDAVEWLLMYAQN